MKVVLYSRVSSTSQAEEGVSLAAQEEKAMAYCSLYGLEIVKSIADPGLSAKSLARPGLQEALALLENGEAEGIVIMKLDRLTRSVSDWGTLIDRYFGKRFALFSVGDQIDTRSAAGRLCLNLLMGVCQWEREACAERTTIALAHIKALGRHVGAIPFGHQLQDGKLVINDEGMRVISLAKSMRDGGATLQAIADELNAKGIQTKRKGRWYPATIKSLLERAA